MEDINDRDRWTKFVNKLITQTAKGQLKWEDSSDKTSRKYALGPIFTAEIIEDKYVAIFRYEFRYYTDEEEYDIRKDVAIELVDEDRRELWRLPEVGERHELIDLLEFHEAGAEATLDEFLKDDNA